MSQHCAAGREFEAAGVRSFVLEQGDGEVVLCMHGVPASCFLYRKVIAELAGRSLRGVAFDLPGLGLAARPPQFDYSWTGLGKFSAAAVDALELGRFHLVVHDIGGPIGFEVAAAMSERIKSLTILNTMIEVERFHRPWMMEPFAHPGVGELWLASMIKPVFRQLMYYAGLRDRSATPPAELDAYVELLRARGRGSRVPEDHARLRADGLKAKPLHGSGSRRSVPRSGGLGRRRPGPEAIGLRRAGAR